VEILPYRSYAKALAEGQRTDIRVYRVGYINAASGVEPVFHYVWKERLTYRGARAFWRHFAAFNAAGIGAFLLKFIVMQGAHFLFVSLGWMQDTSYEPVICNLIGLCFSGTFNFIMSEYVIFNKKHNN
jgi:putative flippase GtrA